MQLHNDNGLGTTGDDGDKEPRDMAGQVVLPPPSAEVHILWLDLVITNSTLRTHVSAVEPQS